MCGRRPHIKTALYLKMINSNYKELNADFLTKITIRFLIFNSQNIILKKY